MGPATVGEPLMLYIGAGWDVEALTHGDRHGCRRFVFIDCIPNRFRYWTEGESGYEISRSEELVVGVVRYKLALLDMAAETQERTVSADGKARVNWRLRNGYDVSYYFNVKYPEDIPSACDGLRRAMAEASILFMKGYPPLPFRKLLEGCPNLSKVVSTDDNIRSAKRDAGEDVLDAFEVHTIDDLDLETIRACENSFEVLQRCIHMF